MAPAGGEALYVLVHTPYLVVGHDWKQMFPAYRKTIMDKLRRCAGMEDIESASDSKLLLTPKTLGNVTACLNGAIYGIASHGRFNGGFKPGNESRF